MSELRSQHMEPVEGWPPPNIGRPEPDVWLYFKETGNPSSCRAGIVAHRLAPKKLNILT